MKRGHFIRSGGMGAIAFHLTVEAVGEDEVVGHFYAVGFHGVGGAVVEVAYVGLVEVGDALFAAGGGFGEGGGAAGCRHGTII
mmetsp:Transcript_13005/g.22182  ORF Transcript_13005/g.22182 Transcript_13005/m.22182 type:complete len:83 (+) Transcript_13005:236-484(+)